MRPRIARLTADDLTNLAVDRGSVPMQIGAVLLLDDATAPVAAELVSLLEQRLARVPRLAERLYRPPLGCGRPYWASAPDHASRIDIAEAADDAALLDAAVEEVLQPLPRDRPLWRAVVYAGRDGRARGVAVVLHHVLADGIGGLAVLAELVDTEGGSPGPVRRARGVLPSRRALARDAWARRGSGLRAVPAAVRRLAAGLRELGGVPRQNAAPSSLLQPTSSRRRVDVVEVELAPVVAGAHARGATVNDVLLVAVSGALREVLRARGDRLAELVVSVPVSGRRAASAEELGNQVGVLPLRVPLTEDPADRLAEIRRQRARLDASAPRASSSAVLSALFRGLAALGVFQWFIRHQRLCTPSSPTFGVRRSPSAWRGAGSAGSFRSRSSRGTRPSPSMCSPTRAGCWCRWSTTPRTWPTTGASGSPSRRSSAACPPEAERTDPGPVPPPRTPRSPAAGTSAPARDPGPLRRWSGSITEDEMATWTTLARQTADHLGAELDLLEGDVHHGDLVEVQRVRERLDGVRVKYLEPVSDGKTPGTSRLGAWWTANQVNDAWFGLHEVETDIERLRPELELVVLKARDHVRRELPSSRYQELTARMDAATGAHDKRVVALDLISLSHRAAESRHEGERQRQRGVLVISGLMLLAAVVTLVLQAFTTEPFVEPPSEGTTVSPRLLLLLVMVFGVLGGLVSAMLSLYVSTKPFPSTTWFDPRPMLTTAKAVGGLWTAVVGVLAVGSGLLVGTYTTLASALLLAFLFGYGQQALTGFLDRRLLEMTKS